MTKRRISIGAVILGVVFMYGSTLLADEAFTAQSIKGNYGFSGSGTLLGKPAAVAGLTRFDGVAGCAITASLNLGGTVAPLTSVSCSYSVNANGTGSQKIIFAGPFGEFVSNFVIVDGNKEIPFVLSDSFGGGTVASGTSKRQGGGDNNKKD